METNTIESICSVCSKLNTEEKTLLLSDTLILYSVHPSCKKATNVFQGYFTDYRDPVMLITNNAFVGSHITKELFSLLLQLLLLLLFVMYKPQSRV